MKEFGMLAYAAHRRSVAQRPSAPHALLLIAVAHVALIAAVMSAKMDVPDKLFPRPTEVDLIELPPPPPRPPEPIVQPKAPPSAVDRVPAIVPLPVPSQDRLDPTPIP